MAIREEVDKEIGTELEGETIDTPVSAIPLDLLDPSARDSLEEPLNANLGTNLEELQEIALGKADLENISKDLEKIEEQAPLSPLSFPLEMDGKKGQEAPSREPQEWQLFDDGSDLELELDLDASSDSPEMAGDQENSIIENTALNRKSKRPSPSERDSEEPLPLEESSHGSSSSTESSESLESSQKKSGKKRRQQSEERSRKKSGEKKRQEPSYREMDHSRDLVLEFEDLDDDLPLPDSFPDDYLESRKSTSSASSSQSPQQRRVAPGGALGATGVAMGAAVPSIGLPLSDDLPISGKLPPGSPLKAEDGAGGPTPSRPLSQEGLPESIELPSFGPPQQQSPAFHEGDLPVIDLSKMEKPDNMSVSLFDLNNENEAAPAEESEESQEGIALSPFELSSIAADTDEADTDLLGSQAEEEATAADALREESQEETQQGAISLSESELHTIMEDMEEDVEEGEDTEGEDTERLEHIEPIDGSPLPSPQGAPSTEEMPLLEKPPSYVGPSPATSVTSADLLSEKLAAEGRLNREELRKMIAYLDRLFDQLPENTVREFSRSEYFDLYKKIMNELGI